MTRNRNRALWAVQCLLALLYLFSGAMKLILPIADLTRQVALPGAFLRFLGAAEVLGAVGLILPGLLRIRPELTPLAASALTVIMVGATALTFAYVGAAPAAMPLVVGLLDVWVAWGRRDALRRTRGEQCWSQS
ncbi:MAG TPA: DoxX family protein [Bryobacteraceae bacterium]|jgi:hypothetical protein|nr:DoxX family protein [Bryobacteraceae bacterium]